MKRVLKAAFLSAALLLTAAPSQADTLRLRSGAVLVGDVTLTDSGDVMIATRFPEEGTFTYKREELTPRSLYDVLDRRSDPNDPASRLELGELAAAAGLYGIAVSDFMAVAKLKPALKKDMDRRIDRVRESIAAGILADAKELMETGNPRGALMYLHTIEERYSKTDAAKEAKKLMATGHSYVGAAADVAKKTVSEDKAPKVITSIDKDFKRGELYARRIGGHEGKSSRSSRDADRAIRYFEAAWGKIKTLPVSAGDSELQAKITRLRKWGKERLAKAYLTAGSIHLQRYSLPRAEEYCNLACELQPEGKDNHELHKLIIQAKINNGGYGWIGR
jgi:hypothetical protein